MKRPRLALAGCASLVWGLAGASYSGSGSGSDGYSSGTGEVVSGRDTSGDSCAYYALEPGESCRQPRSCYDCLNVELPSEDEGCLLSQFGACESMTFYDATLDFRAEGSMADSGSPTDFTGGWFHQFPAVNTTYCEASDPACVECDAIARNMSADSNFIAQTTKFCVGSSGCVCILSCEATVFAARAIAQCEASSSSGSASSPAPVEAYMDTGSSSSSSSRSSSSSSSAGLTRENHGVVVLWLTVVVVAFVIALAVGFYVRYVRQPRGRRTPRHTLSSAAQLQLAGWRALHEELIQQQKTSGSDDSRRIELATISPDAPPR